MIDPFETVLRDRFAALRDPVPPPDLNDVRDRFARLREAAPRPSRFSRPLTLAVVLVVAGLLAAGAYALYETVIVGSPAPPAVLASEAVLERVEDAMAAMPGFRGMQIEASRTRAGAVLDTSAGPVYLWVAPTRSGSRCMFLQITGLDLRFAGGSPFLLSAGCVDPQQPQTELVRVNTGVGGHTLPLVAGYLAAPASSLQLRFSDGTMSRRYAAHDGFVLALGSRYDPSPTAILRDRGGSTTAPSPVVRQLFVSASPTGAFRFTFTIRLPRHEGTLAFSAGPAPNGGSLHSHSDRAHQRGRHEHAKLRAESADAKRT